MLSYAERMSSDKSATRVATKSSKATTTSVAAKQTTTQQSPSSASAPSTTASTTASTPTTAATTNVNEFDLTSDAPIVAKQRVIGVGIVKSVLSGDTIVVRGKSDEKRIVIYDITAPKLGQGKGATDEPYAYQSREYLRNLLLGKKVQIVFQSSDSVFADVSINGEDVATKIVENGWATANLPKAAKETFEAEKATQKSVQKLTEAISNLRLGPTKENLLNLQLAAEKKKIGIYSAGSGQRTVAWDVDNSEYYTHYKNKTIKATVERVLDGSTFRVLVPGIPAATDSKNDTLSQAMVVISLVGALSPRVFNDDKKGNNADKKNKAPFAAEALELCDARLAGRDVTITIVAMDKSKVLYATVAHPKGNIALRLLESGFALPLPWTSAILSPAEQKLYREAFFKAKDEKIGLYSLPANAEVKYPVISELEEFDGTVVQIITGNTILVRDAHGKDHRISLASVEAPRMGASGVEPFAFEAKDFLRRSLIQKPVKVVLEFTRKFAKKQFDAGKSKNARNNDRKGKAKKTETDADAEAEAETQTETDVDVDADTEIKDEKTESVDESTATPSVPAVVEYEVRQFATVFKGKVNVGVELVQNGLADVTPYSKEAERSLYYANLLAAEAMAIKNVAGKHNKKTVSDNILDLTSNFSSKTSKSGDKSSDRPAARQGSNANAQRMKIIETKLIASPVPAFIDAVYNATRVKVYVPAVNAFLSLTISGITVPAGNGKDKHPVHTEAVQYLRSFVQQDVEIEVLGLNKFGDSLVGHLYILPQRESVALTYLRRGYASVVPRAIEKNNLKKTYLDAEAAAKKKHVGMWENYDEEKERAERERARVEAFEAGLTGLYEEDGIQYFPITITDVIDGTNFYFCASKDPNAALIAKTISELDCEAIPVPEDFSVKPGDVVLARFSDDNSWYRARVDSNRAEIVVQFLEYGNYSTVTMDNIRPCPKSIVNIKQIARPGTLSALRPPARSSDHFEASGDAFAQAANGIELVARIDAYERRKDNTDLFHLTLIHKGEELSINEFLVSNGWVRLMQRPLRRLDALVPELEAHQEEARLARRCIWQYGACVSDTEDNGLF